MSKNKPDALFEGVLLQLPEDLESCLDSEQRSSGLAIDELILKALNKHYARELRKAKKARQCRDTAPMDRYLPAGASPFDHGSETKETFPLDFALISQRTSVGSLDKLLNGA